MTPWVIEATWSPIVMRPVRSLPPLTATWTPTEPFPLPLTEVVNEIQPESVVAVHAQSLPVETVMLPVPPAAVTV